MLQNFLAAGIFVDINHTSGYQQHSFPKNYTLSMGEWQREAKYKLWQEMNADK